MALSLTSFMYAEYDASRFCVVKKSVSCQNGCYLLRTITYDLLIINAKKLVTSTVKFNIFHMNLFY